MHFASMRNYLIRKWQANVAKPKSRRVIFAEDVSGRYEEDSEKSYVSLTTVPDLIESFVFLHIDILFMTMFTIANFILFCKQTTRLVYPEFAGMNGGLVVELFCYILIYIEITSTLLHKTCKSIAAKRPIRPRKLSVIIVYMVLQTVCLFVYHATTWTHPTLYLLELFRLMSVVNSFRVLAINPSRHNVMFTLFKFTLFMIYVVQIALTTAGLFNHSGGRTWKDMAKRLLNAGYTEVGHYIFLILNVLSASTSLGLHGASPGNDCEYVTMIMLMWLGEFLTDGIFIGACTSLQILNYKVKATFYNTLKLINKNLEDARVPSKIKRRIQRYYRVYWAKEGATSTSVLFFELPKSFQLRILGDKFWNILSRPRVFQDLHAGFRRALSEKMRTEIYATGEIILSQNLNRDTLMFITRGSIQILSPEDLESPLITLGVDTCIGEINLTYNSVNPVQVVASSYCVIYTLNKLDFWMTAAKFRKMHQSRIIHENTQRILLNAMNKLQERQTDSDLTDQRRHEIRSTHIFAHDLYVLNDEFTQGNFDDDVFFRTRFPWILQPSSSLILYWNLLIVFAVVVSAISIPYVSAFDSITRDEVIVHYIFMYLQVLYVLDVFLQLFIVTEDEYGLHTSISEIFFIRIRTFEYMLDIIAAIPFPTIFYNFSKERYMRIIKFLPFLRLVKFHKIIWIFSKTENTFKINLVVLRIIKYNSYLLFLAYLMGTAFFINSCPHIKHCAKSSWVYTIQKQYPFLPLKHIYIISIQNCLLVLILTGGGLITQTSLTELVIMIFYNTLGISLFTYIAADFGASLTLMEQSLTEYSTNLLSIQKLSEKTLTRSDTKNNLRRIVSYLSAQWQYNRGHTTKTLLADVPQPLYNAQQCAKYKSIIEGIKLFEGMEPKFHELLATKCEENYFAKNEIFIYSNEKCRATYIIERGYCELISGKNKRLESVLGPGSVICLTELLLDLNSLFFVRPITSVVVLKITRTNILGVIRNFKNFNAILENYKRSFRNSLAMERLYDDKIVKITHSDYEEQMPSFFIFPSDRTEQLYKDFQEGWTEWTYLKYFMMRQTIMPEGKFLLIWEIINNVSAFILINLTLTIDVWTSQSINIIYLIYSLEIFQIIGIYVRLHVCYYNSHGLLITHPRLTARNYLTGAFLTDMVASIPMYLMLVNFKGRKGFSSSIFAVNRILSMYRFPLTLYYFTRDELKPRSTFVTVMKYLPITIVFLNCCVTVLITISTSFNIDSEGNEYLRPRNHSLAHHMANVYKETTDYKVSAGNQYLLFFFWVTTVVSQYGIAGIVATHLFEMFLTTFIMVSGYLLFTYILVVIANSQTKINSHQIEHQNRMKHVVNFMKRKKINKSIQRQAIQYFEYNWQQTHGITTNDMLSRCHIVLFEDYTYDQFKITFMHVSVFRNLNSTLFRKFSRHLHRLHLISDINFIKVNDVVSHLYIVHSGQIEVHGPTGELMDSLNRGALLGNIDNVSATRSMVSYRSIRPVQLLMISTIEFYRLMPATIAKAIQVSLLLNHLSYIKGVLSSSENSGRGSIAPLLLRRTESRRTKVLQSTTFNMITMILSYTSCVVITYISTFFDGNPINYYIVYSLDFVTLIIIILKFFTPYNDSKGVLIATPSSIKSYLIREPWFYFNLMSIVPFEIVMWVSQASMYYANTIFRVLILNRCLRFYTFYKFFKEQNNKLNSDMLYLKLSSIFLTVTFILHLQSCLLCLMTTNGTTKYTKDTWAYQMRPNSELELICGGTYICALYFSTSMMTMTGFTIYPRNVTEVVLCFTFLLLDKFIISSSGARLSACIQNNSADLTFFNFRLMRLKTYLRRSFISKPLLRIVFNYIDQIWVKNEGEQEPILLVNAPEYLQEEIKTSAFYKLIKNNVVFGKCHPDFLRQLIKTFHTETFFKNDMICQQGDINETIYFVYEGLVDVLYLTETEEILVDQLEELDCFGIIQGLFPRTPHTHSFRAITVTVLVTLKLSEWYTILKFYPAAKFYIYDKMSTVR